MYIFIRVFLLLLSYFSDKSLIFSLAYNYLRAYIYCFGPIFQGLHLFEGLHLLDTPEYLFLGQEWWISEGLSICDKMRESWAVKNWAHLDYIQYFKNLNSEYLTLVKIIFLFSYSLQQITFKEILLIFDRSA